MKITLIREDNARTSVWSGGVSKEYYLFPPTASYQGRDFSFRISVAQATSEGEAPYTNLPGITRHLVMLEGVAHVFHQGRYDLVMHPYREIDVFDGGWPSSGKGKVTDLNLMVGAGYHGVMTVIDKGGPLPVALLCETCRKVYSHTAFFNGSGNPSLVFSTGEVLHLSPGDLVMVEEGESGDTAEVTLNGAKLVRMDVCCTQ